MSSKENTRIFLETVDTMIKYRTMLPNLIDTIYEAPMRQARLTNSQPDIPEGDIDVLYEAVDYIDAELQHLAKEPALSFSTRVRLHHLQEMLKALDLDVACMIITRFWDDQNRQDILDRIAHRTDADREKWGPGHRARMMMMTMPADGASSPASDCDTAVDNLPSPPPIIA